jgi:hypothetical protein
MLTCRAIPVNVSSRSQPLQATCQRKHNHQSCSRPESPVLSTESRAIPRSPISQRAATSASKSFALSISIDCISLWQMSSKQRLRRSSTSTHAGSMRISSVQRNRQRIQCGRRSGSARLSTVISSSPCQACLSQRNQEKTHRGDRHPESGQNQDR